MVIVFDAMHNPVAVSMKHVFVVSNSVPVAKGVVPVMLLYVAVVPGSSVITSGVATGTGGGVTVGVIVAESIWPVESVTWYVSGNLAVPEKVGSGSKVTTPLTNV
jgi:hypothetical protein